METKRHAAHQSFRPPSAGASKIVTERDHTNLSEELLAVLLHDLRSPLGAIAVLADLIASISKEGDAPDIKQLSLLQEAVTKAHRVMDDALEIQSFIRGSSTLTPALIEISSIVRTCLEKAVHAPYFRNVEINYSGNGSADRLIRVDVEKAETALLCAFEHVISQNARPASVSISHTVEDPFVSVHIAANRPVHSNEPPAHLLQAHESLIGRLGTRRLGESRFDMQVCRRVMHLMGGELESIFHEAGLSLALRFPAAAI